MSHANDVCVRIKDGADDFKLLFVYRRVSAKADAQFYFQRRLAEPVNALLSRISLKINALNRKKQNKNKNLAEESETPVTVNLYKNGVSVPQDAVCQDVFQVDDSSEITLKIGERSFSVRINQPWIENIKLSSNIMAGYAAYPYKLEGHFMNEDESKFLWFKDSSANQLRNDDSVASGLIYVPKVDDIGYYLRLVCTPIKDGVEGLSVETRSPKTVQAGPGPCPFEDRHIFTANCLSGDSYVRNDLNERPAWLRKTSNFHSTRRLSDFESCRTIF